MKTITSDEFESEISKYWWLIDPYQGNNVGYRVAKAITEIWPDGVQISMSPVTTPRDDGR